MKKLRWKEIFRPGEAFHSARVTYNRRNGVPYHGHDFAEVFWIDEGSGVHRVNASRQPLKAGMVVFIRPEDAHSIETGLNEELRFTNIAFSSETRDFLGKRYFGDTRRTFWSEEELPETQMIDAHRLALFNRLADSLARSGREVLAIERFLMNLLAELEEKGIERQLPAEMPDWLTAACHQMQKPENLAGGAPAFLKLAGRGREHTARSMRKYLGMSPTEYVNDLRMKHAGHLLEMSNQNILEIALDCGTENLSHFYKLFRATHGTTPHAYRGAHRRTV